MSDVKIRAFSGFVFVTVTVLSILWNKWSFLLLMLIFAYLMVNEFYNLFRKKGYLPDRFIGISSAISLTAYGLLCIFGYLPILFAAFFFPLMSISFVKNLFQKNNAFVSLAVTYFGVVYTIVPLIFLAYMSFIGGVYNPQPVIGVFVMIWVNDTFAYLVGRQVGKTKLFESISPNKTWEGSIGGAIFVMATAIFFSYLFPILTLTDWLVIGVLTAVTGTYGDLVQSKLKRSLEVKDSGSLMPGHGGALDRLDSLIYSIPFVGSYLILVGY